MISIKKQIVEELVPEDVFISQKQAELLTGLQRRTLVRSKEKFGATRDTERSPKGKFLKYSLRKVLEYTYEKKKIYKKQFKVA